MEHLFKKKMHRRQRENNEGREVEDTENPVRANRVYANRESLKGREPTRCSARAEQ